ncbi:DUF6126 family protein [Streptomyces sp. NPDC051940]
MDHDTRSGDVREERFPRGLVIRLLVYLVVGHVLAAFLYLLFETGAGQ